MARKVNLLIVASSLWIGGAESVIRHLAESLDRRRFRVTVCYLKQLGQIGEELRRAGVDIVGITDDPDPPVDYFTFRKLLRVIREKRIDVIHTHTTHGLVDASLCKLFVPRLRLLHTFHFGNYPDLHYRLRWMERVFSRMADRLYAVGEAQRERLRSAYGLTEGQIRTIRNGVAEVVGPGSDEFRRIHAPSGHLLVGTVATLIEQKGLFDLLEVARQVTARGHKVSFVVTGEGHLRAQLEARRDALGLSEIVSFPGWVTNAADVALPTFDIFFQPSHWEAMSMVVLEAMSAGRPIVATRVGENPHVIQHAANGMLVEPGDISGMAEAIERLAQDPSLRHQLGEAGRRTVHERFTITHMTRAYEDAYLETLR